MLQLYLKHKVSSIFEKLSLYQIFCHFAFCKKTCDKDTVFCRTCSRVWPKILFFELGFFDRFDEIIIDNRFSDKFKAFFLPKHHMYLETYYPYYKYINSENAKLLVVCIMRLDEAVSKFLKLF